MGTKHKANSVNNDLYRAILQNASDGFLMIDPEGRILEVNKSYCRMSGYSNRELFAMRIQEIEAARTSAERLVQIRDAKEVRQVCYETSHHRKDGKLLLVEINMQYLPFDGGRYIEIVHDVTAKKAAEEKLRLEEKKLRLITDSINEVFWMADVQIGKMFYVSPSFERIWGRSRESLYEDPKLFLKAVHSEDQEKVRMEFEIAKSVGNPFDQEYRIVLPDGGIRFIWDRGFPVKDDSGFVSCYAGVATDITERKLIQRKLESSEERLRIALQSAKHVLYDLDLTTGIAQEFGESCFINSVDSEVASISTDNWSKLLHPDDRDRTLRAFRDYVAGRIPEYTLDYRAKIISGEWKWIHSTGKIIAWDDTGKPVRMVGTNTDISNQKAFENELQSQKDLLYKRSEQLEKANSALMDALKNRDAERKAIEQSIYLNLQKLILPNIAAISNSKLEPRAVAHLKIIKDNLEAAIDSSDSSAAMRYKELTAREAQVADLIRQGLSSKEIAKVLGVSVSAISYHRDNIRKKLRVTTRKHDLKRVLN